MFNNSALKIILTVSICFTCLIGDEINEHMIHDVIRAIIDNLTHATVAGLSWALLILLLKESIVQNLVHIVLCALLSSFIDLDHFIQAQSLSLSDATRLRKRPFLHSTTVPIVIWTILLTLSKVQNSEKMERYSWIILMSFISHHIRDANRRGFWFSPFGSTRPLPYIVYITITILLPYVLSYLVTRTILSRKSQDYEVYQMKTPDTV